MKTLFLLLLITIPSIAQERNVASQIRTNNSVAIWGRSFAAGVTDTTEAIEVSQFKTIYVSLMALDSATFLIDYQLSVNGSNWTASTTIDSLSHGAAGNAVKSIDFTSTILGVNYIRFVFRTSANAFPLGTTTPTYYASRSLKRF